MKFACAPARRLALTWAPPTRRRTPSPTRPPGPWASSRASAAAPAGPPRAVGTWRGCSPTCRQPNGLSDVRSACSGPQLGHSTMMCLIAGSNSSSRHHACLADVVQLCTRQKDQKGYKSHGFAVSKGNRKSLTGHCCLGAGTAQSSPRSWRALQVPSRRSIRARQPPAAQPPQRQTLCRLADLQMKDG